MFQRSKTGYSSSVQNVLWLMSSNVDIAGGLLAPRNLFYPNLRVTKVSFIGKIHFQATFCCGVNLVQPLLKYGFILNGEFLFNLAASVGWCTSK